MKEMKGKIIACIGTLFLMGLILGSWSADAQTYKGYIILEGDSVKGPDSLLVSVNIPEEVFSRDTVYLKHKELRRMQRASKREYSDAPWMMGVKTNLLSDAIAIPYAGFDFQMTDKLSFNLNGWFTPMNIFYPNKSTKIYGLAPEFRLWLGDRVMSKGYFAGIHANLAWYTLEWRNEAGNKVVYQNGIEDLMDNGTMYPSWSVGLTYGYSQPLDRKERWNLEFYMGVGYASSQQKCFTTTAGGSTKFTHERNSYIGITKVGIDLTYRFSLLRVK